LGVWNGLKGDRLETVSTDYCIEAMTRLGDSIVSANKDRIEVRRLKYGRTLFSLLLIDLCSDEMKTLITEKKKKKKD